MKCPECDADIVYLDRWFKKCANGHTTPTKRFEFQEWKRARKAKP